MARRMKSKSRKYLGNTTHGAGNRKNRRGKGSRGGVGRGGYHKHRWFQTLKYEGPSQTEAGFFSPNRKKFDVVKLNDLVRDVSLGKHAASGDKTYTIDLVRKGKAVKVLGNGRVPFKLNVKANVFSASAKEKIEKAGGIAQTV